MLPKIVPMEQEIIVAVDGRGDFAGQFSVRLVLLPEGKFRSPDTENAGLKLVKWIARHVRAGDQDFADGGYQCRVIRIGNEVQGRLAE